MSERSRILKNYETSVIYIEIFYTLVQCTYFYNFNFSHDLDNDSSCDTRTRMQSRKI